MSSHGSSPRRNLSVLALVLVVLAFGVPASAALDEPKPLAKPVAPDHSSRMARGLDLFKKDVRAILIETHCLKCHGGATTKGDFDLATREALLEEGAEGPVVVPGDSKEQPPLQAGRPPRKTRHARQGSQAPRRSHQEAGRLDRRRSPLRPTTRRRLEAAAPRGRHRRRPPLLVVPTP